MSDTTSINDLLDELYGVVQDAKGAMLQPDKCILDRNEVLNIIDDIIAVLPEEVKSAKKIVEARNELVGQGRREAENMVTTARTEATTILERAKKEADILVSQATEKANAMVSKERVVIEAENRSREMIDQAQVKIEELKRVSNTYMAKSLAEAEQAMEKSLNELKATKRKFENLTGVQSNNNNPVPTSNKSAFFQEIGD